MLINPKTKTVIYSIENLEVVEDALNEIERTALEGDDVTGDAARDIVANLNVARNSLCLNRGVQRHPKFAPELKRT